MLGSMRPTTTPCRFGKGSADTSLHLCVNNFIGYLSLRTSNSKFSFSCSNLNWVLLQNIFVTKFSVPSLSRHCVLSDPLTGLTFSFPVLGPQWLNPGPLPA